MPKGATPIFTPEPSNTQEYLARLRDSEGIEIPAVPRNTYHARFQKHNYMEEFAYGGGVRAGGTLRGQRYSLGIKSKRNLKRILKSNLKKDP